MSKKNRLIFATIWSILSLFGILFFKYNLSLFSSFLLFGFHIPRDCLYFFLGYGLYSDYPQLGMVFLLIFVAFAVIWIVALFRLTKSKLFEYIIWADCVFSLVIYVGTVILLQNFSIYMCVPIVRLLIENIILISIKLHRKKTNNNTYISI